MWWIEEGHLTVKRNSLFIGPYKVSKLAKEVGTPVFIYNLFKVEKNFKQLEKGMKNAGLNQFKICYSMKANNHPLIIEKIKTLGGGIDTTSPGEVRWALKHGFSEKDIIFTGTSLSNDDLEFLNKCEGVLINFDSISSLRRFKGKKGREIGLRINTGIGLGRNVFVTTGGVKAKSLPVKFGIPVDKLKEAVEIIKKRRWKLKCIHHHVGSDWMGEKINKYLQALKCLLEVTRKVENMLGYEVEVIDLGGGFGVPHSAEEKEFPVDMFFQKVYQTLSSYGKKCKVIIEPGNFITGNAGILAVEVNTVEEKHGRLFVGVNAGLNVFNSPSLYHIYHEIVVCDRCTDRSLFPVTVVGNICETVDIFAIDRLLPSIKEGDILAILNAGAYGSVMSNEYNLRPKGREVVVMEDKVCI